MRRLGGNNSGKRFLRKGFATFAKVEGLTLCPAASLLLQSSNAGERRRAEAERALAVLQAQPDASPYLIATLYAGLGDKERAFGMLEQAVEKAPIASP